MATTFACFSGLSRCPTPLEQPTSKVGLCFGARFWGGTVPVSVLPARPVVRPPLWWRLLYVVGPLLVSAVYVAMLLPYLRLRSYADEFLPWLDGAAIEQAIVRGNAPAALQSLWYPGNEWLDFAGFGLHIGWFFLPIVMALALAVFERGKLAEMFAWLLVMAYIGNVMFFLFPLEPPWMDDSVSRILIDRSFINYTGLDDNPVAAFPSFHAGVPLLLTMFFAMRSERLKSLAWIPFAATLLISFAVVYLGEHWLIDIAAGWALASFTAWLMVSRRVRRLVSRIPGDPVSKLIAANQFLCVYGPNKKRSPAAPVELDEFAPRRRAA